MVFGVAEVLHGDKRYLSMPDKAFWWTPVFAGLVSSLPDTARLTLLGLRPLKIMFASLPRKMARKPQTKLLVPSFIPPSKWTNWRTQFNKIYCLRASLGQGEGFICIYIYLSYELNHFTTFDIYKQKTFYILLLNTLAVRSRSAHIDLASSACPKGLWLWQRLGPGVSGLSCFSY